MIKNVILDMGNVLLDYNPEFVLERFCSSEEEKNIIRRELFEGPEWAMGDRGEIRDKDRYDYVKERVPREHWEALKRCANEWAVCMVPLPGAKDFCEFVKQKRYGIYVLSNASDLFYEYFLNFSPLDYFDGVVVSVDVHITKPDRGIYRYLLEKYHLKAEECLFIDDRADNVEGARKVGMQAVQFVNNFAEIADKYLNIE